MTRKVEVFSGLDRLRRHVDSFQELAASTQVTPGAQWESVEPWLRHRPHVRPLAVRVSQDGCASGLAILSAVRRRGIWRIGKAGVAGEPYGFMFGDDEDLAALHRGIGRALRLLHNPWTLVLEDMPDAAQCAGFTEVLPNLTLGRGLPSPVLDVGSGQSLRTVLSRNTRCATAKAYNRLRGEDRALTVTWLTEADELSEQLDAIAEIRLRRNQLLGRDRSDVDPAELPTFRDTILGHARAGRAKVLLVQIDGSTAAYAVCFLSGHEMWVYSNSMSPDYTRYSPGTLANAEVVREALCDPSIDVVNWGAGIQRYKMSGPVTVRYARTVEAWSSSTIRVWDSAVPRIRRRLLLAS